MQSVQKKVSVYLSKNIERPLNIGKPKTRFMWSLASILNCQFLEYSCLENAKRIHITDKILKYILSNT